MRTTFLSKFNTPIIINDGNRDFLRIFYLNICSLLTKNVLLTTTSQRIGTTAAAPHRRLKPGNIVISVLLIILLSIAAAFAIEIIRWKLRNAVLLTFLEGIMILAQIVLLPLFTIYYRTGLLNSYAL